MAQGEQVVVPFEALEVPGRQSRQPSLSVTGSRCLPAEQTEQAISLPARHSPGAQKSHEVCPAL
eukprot:scaffold11418_cov70-Phaeocystis_antarctica.AAC.1